MGVFISNKTRKGTGVLLAAIATLAFCQCPVAAAHGDPRVRQRRSSRWHASTWLRADTTLPANMPIAPLQQP
jgi:hypothetical protein